MISCTRLSGNLSKMAIGSSRRLSMERLTSKDFQIVKNPSNEHIDAYEKLVGPFNDIKLLKQTMKDDFRLYLLCLKDSDKVISGIQSTTYKSLNGSEGFRAFGLSDQSESSFEMLPRLMQDMCEDLDAVNTNSGGCIDSKSAAIWRKILHAKVRGPTYYVSHYKANEIFNPDLEFADITVKEFSDVPAGDVVGYDNSIFPYERSEFLLAKFQRGIGRVAYDKAGKVIGIGLVSVDQASGNCDIGPVYCDGTTAAQAIFQSIVQKLPVKDLNEIRIRCSDKFEGSATWIRPFLRRRHEMTPFAHIKFNRSIPAGMNFSKVFVNSNPSSAPC